MHRRGLRLPAAQQVGLPSALLSPLRRGEGGHSRRRRRRRRWKSDCHRRCRRLGREFRRIMGTSATGGTEVRKIGRQLRVSNNSSGVLHNFNYHLCSNSSSCLHDGLRLCHTLPRCRPFEILCSHLVCQTVCNVVLQNPSDFGGIRIRASTRLASTFPNTQWSLLLSIMSIRQSNSTKYALCK